MQRLISRTQGKHAYLMQQSCPLEPFLSSTPPLLFAGKAEEQAGPDISQLAPRLQQEWEHAANAHLGRITITPQSIRTPGGGAACARPGSRTGGKRSYKVAQKEPNAPMILAEQCAPVKIWLTVTQRWQESGTGRPTGRGHQRLWQQGSLEVGPLWAQMERCSDGQNA